MSKVLIADDDQELQELLKFAFESNGYEVITANDGDETLKKVQSDLPDLIILDLLMPKINGYEVCERLRSNPSTCLTPIIMLTSLTHPKDRITGIKLGADEYISKPFEVYELLAVSEKVIERNKQLMSLNSLTGLPVQTHLESELKKLLEKNEMFELLLLDINNFDRYNSVYGYDKGDDVLRLIAGLLKGIIGQIGKGAAFHLSGDDFCVLCDPGNGEIIALRMIESIENFFSPDTLTISIGIKSVNPKDIKHHSQVIKLANELLKTAKSQSSGSNSYSIG